MTEIESIATQRRASARLIGGTLRFWGKWFGGAHDNIHTVIGCNVDNDCLRVYFDEGEILSVWFRRQGTDNGDTFRIVDGQCLRWEWFYYGRAKVRKNLYFQEVVKS